MRLALVATFLCYFLANTSAQTSESTEKSDFKFGINLGINYSNAFAVEQLPASATLSNGFGFRLEILAEYQLFNRIYASPKAGFSFNESKLIIANGLEVDMVEEYLILPVTFETAVHFLIKKDSPNKRANIYFGPSLKVPAQNRRDRNGSFGNKFTTALDFGVQFDKDFGYFQFVPEFRYSIGVENVASQQVVGDIIFQSFSLIFNFLG